MLIKQNHYHRESQECSRSVIHDCGCDQEGRKLSWETRAEEVGFEVLCFLKDATGELFLT